MNKLENAIHEIHNIDTNVDKDQWVNHIHPLVKLIITVCFIVITTSFPKYNLTKLLLMGVYLIVVFVLGGVSFKDALRRLRVVLPIVCFIGVLNPFFDRQPVIMIGSITITTGIISMFALMIKGIYSVLASYLLIATTSIEKICYALRLLHVPAVIVTQIMLTYRYVSLLLYEANRTIHAYTLRAPNQKGVHIKVWGSLVGHLLLKSMDRANEVYESMTLRGYRGEFDYAAKMSCSVKDYIYMAVWCAIFFCFRFL